MTAPTGQWADADVEVRVQPYRSLDDLALPTESTLLEILAELRKLSAARGSSSDSRSSIEIKTSTRGVDISSKCYADSPMDGLVDTAVANYFDTMSKVQARINGAAAA